jgi:hypothetical protein
MVRCGSRNTLVGREPELTALAGLIGDTGAGRGRAALMLGEAGIGKMRLAEVAETMARESSFEVAWGRCVGRHAVVLAVEAGAIQPGGRNRPP